jgi:GcrA cell cycle regulator
MADDNAVSAELLAQANSEVGQGWTKARVACVKGFYRQGLSASQIAARVGGVSRNAVIGILHRAGISDGRRVHHPRSKKPRLKTPTPKKQSPLSRLPSPYQAMFAASASAPPPTLVEDIVVPEKQQKTIMELEGHHCRWPLGPVMAVATHFCGGDKFPGLPYCIAHSRIAFQPPEGRRRTALWATQRAAGEKNASGGGEGSQSQTAGAGELVREHVGAK